MAMFQPVPTLVSLTRQNNVNLVEQQYDYYVPHRLQEQTGQVQIAPTQVPITYQQNNTLPIVAIVSLLGFFGLLAFLAYCKR